MKPLLFAVSVAVAALVTTPPAAHAVEEGVLVADASVYAGPSESAKRLGTLNKGKPLQIGKYEKQWAFVRFRVGSQGAYRYVTGWIVRSALTSGAQTQAQRGSAAHAPVPPAVITDDPPARTSTLRVRVGPMLSVVDSTFVSPGVVSAKSRSTHAGARAEVATDLNRFATLYAYGANAWTSTAGSIGPAGKQYQNLSGTLSEAGAELHARVAFGPAEARAIGGYRLLYVGVDQITGADNLPLGLISTAYYGPVAGGGLGLHLKRFGLEATALYWVSPTVHETTQVRATGTGPSGQPGGSSALTLRLLAGADDVLPGLGIHVYGETTRMSASFSGPGRRFNQAIDGAAGQTRALSAGFVLAYHR